MPDQDPVVDEFNKIYTQLAKNYKNITPTDAALALLAKAIGQLGGHISNLITWGEDKWANPKMN